MMFQTGFTLGRIFGVRITVDWGLSILALLLVFNLGAGLLPVWHPDWSPWLSWSVASAAALCFILSLLLHELSHAVVGRSYGIPIESITLFIFGGSANMDDEPPSARAEFLMAVVGPLTSILLGVLLTGFALPSVMRALATHDQALHSIGALGPVTTLLFWLGPTNVLLGLFNIIPAFPLDGGRILRAALWALTGNMHRATRLAATVGQLFAWGLILLGVAMMVGTHIPYLGGGFGQGLWFAFIGWFLNSAAAMSYQQLLTRELLASLRVSAIMRPEVTTVDADTDLATLERIYFTPNERRSYVVTQGDDIVGVVSHRDLGRIPSSHWATTRAGDVMSHFEDSAVLSPEEDSVVALSKLRGKDIEQMPVVKDGRVAGLLRRRDVLRWLELESRNRSAAAAR